MSRGKNHARIFMRRSMIISGIAIAIISILIFLIATSFGLIAQYELLVDPVVKGVLGIALLAFLYISLIILFGNLREWYGESASWFEVIIFWVVVVVIAAVGFGPIAALVTALLCIGFVYYLYLAQD
jgi:hypothetical protein